MSDNFLFEAIDHSQSNSQFHKMLPTSASRVRRPSSVYSQYFRRLIRPKQMDFEFASWWMIQLCFAPKKAYLHAIFHKETKNHWFRDDPAYIVLLSFFIFVSSCVYCISYEHGFWTSIKLIIYVIFGEFLILGALLATFCWFITNRFLIKRSGPSQSTAGEMHVEWLYAFDVQCNSYFALFLCLHVVQFVLSPILLSKTFLAAIVSNALYAFALGYYHYLNFLGYSSLPFLEKTEVFLYPIGLIILTLPFSILTTFNPTRFVFSLYFSK